MSEATINPTSELVNTKLYVPTISYNIEYLFSTEMVSAHQVVINYVLRDATNLKMWKLLIVCFLIDGIVNVMLGSNRSNQYTHGSQLVYERI